jgi:hypothetical protein
MASKEFSSDTMAVYLRPVVEDAAESLAYAGYVESVEVVLAAFDAASVETLQFSIMSAVQFGVLDMLGTKRLPTFDDVPTIDD